MLWQRSYKFILFDRCVVTWGFSFALSLFGFDFVRFRRESKTASSCFGDHSFNYLGSQGAPVSLMLQPSQEPDSDLQTGTPVPRRFAPSPRPFFLRKKKPGTASYLLSSQQIPTCSRHPI